MAFDFEEMMARSDVEIKSKLFDYSDLMKQESFAIKKYKTSVYKGCLDKDDHRSGLGI